MASLSKLAGQVWQVPHLGVSEIRGTLFGALLYGNDYIKGPLFSSTPSLRTAYESGKGGVKGL